MKLPLYLHIRGIDARAGAWRAAPHSWLSAAEQDELARWRDPARRDEWLTGRWLLKEMVLRLDCSMGSDVEILSRDVHGRGRPPCVLAFGCALPLHVSLAHAGGTVWAALSTSPRHRVGIDLVPADSFHRHAGPLWFTDAELRRLEQPHDPFLPATLWAAKEAVYKATSRGEPFVPARIEVGRHDSGHYTWSRDGVPTSPDDTLFFRRTAGSILALAVVQAACTNTGVRHD
jgi:4'-phosphopantetheinyl transferase EntD